MSGPKDIHTKIRKKVEDASGTFYCITCASPRPVELKVKKGRSIRCKVCTSKRVAQPDRRD